MKETLQLTLKPRQKAAILLCELGATKDGKDLVEYIYSLLHLSKDQEIMLAQEIKKLGRYNPNNSLMVERENVVLQEFLDWGNRKGFKIPQTANNDYLTALGSNTEQVAAVLQSWLKE